MNEILEQVRKIVENEIIPLESKIGMDWHAAEPELNKVRALVKERGLWLPHISKEYGGLGLSLYEFGQVNEILGRSPFGHYCFNCQAPDAGNMELLMEFGSDYQKEKFLQPLLDGDIRSCFSMTEPEFAGSNPIMMGTTAKADGENYIVNGHKWFTSSADGAAFAIVMAMTDPDNDDRYGRASQIIVELDNPGFELVRNISIMGEEGAGWASHAEVRYTNCRVPAHNLIGEEGSGFTLAQKRLGPGRIHHCMRWIGICERSFDLMCERANERVMAPGQLLADKQTIQNWIAESRAEINAARLMVLDAARKMDEHGSSAVKEEISLIKFFCADVLQQVLDRAIQVHGALGMTDDTPLAWWYRHERGARIYDGADEVHKSRVAKMILKKYRT